MPNHTSIALCDGYTVLVRDLYGQVIAEEGAPAQMLSKQRRMVVRSQLLKGCRYLSL